MPYKTALNTEVRRRVQRALRTRSFRAALHSSTGAIDLASIMVGVIVIGVIAGVIAATVFAVIPWSQDSAAKNSLDAVRTAESVQYAQSAGSGASAYTDLAGLVAGKLIQSSPSVVVGVNAAATCYVGIAKSATGKAFYITSAGPDVKPFTGTTTSTCLSAAELSALADTLPGAVPALGLIYTNTAFTRGTTSEALTATPTGGTGSYAYSYTGTLPTGFTFNTSTGAFTGPSSWGITFKTITSGGMQTCAIAVDDRLYCWGNNESGQVGDGTNVNRFSPTLVGGTGLLGGKTVKLVSAGYEQTCALATDNKLYCWGYNDYGQLGTGVTSSVRGGNLPAPVLMTGLLAGKTIASLSAATSSTCVLDTAGIAYCWGRGSWGNLGNNAFTDSNAAPVAVDMTGALAGKTLKTIFGGALTTCAIASDDHMYCWGYNYYGALGIGTSGPGTTVAAPVAVGGPLAGKTVTSIALGFWHSCALTSDNITYCWGRANYNQLGTGDYTDADIPTAVYADGALAGKTLKTLSAGQYNTCVLDVSGAGYCWGNDESGELAIGPAVYTIGKPTAMIANRDLNGRPLGMIASSAAVGAMCELDTTGYAYCQGYSVLGTLGAPAGNTNQPQSVVTSGLTLNFTTPVTVTVTSGTKSVPVDVVLTTR